MNRRLLGFGSFVERCMEDWRVPGCAVGIVRRNRLIYARGLGLRGVERKLPVTERTAFPIKSCTKAFTAAATAILVDEGELEWDIPIREYLPSFRMCDPVATRQSTVGDLLAHGSGLATHYAALYTSLATGAGVLARLPYLEPSREFRSGFQYANLGYAVAGAVLEHVAGTTWQQFVRTRLFRPLGMRWSGFGTDDANDLGDLAVGYRKGSRRPAPWFSRKEFSLAAVCEPKAAAMGVVSNVPEMCRWLRFQMSRGKVGKRRIVRARVLGETHRAQIGTGGRVRSRHLSDASHAMGWYVQRYRGRRWLHHSGSGHGYSAHVSFLPAASVGVVVLSNSLRTPLRWVIPFNVYDRLLGLDLLPWQEQYLRIAKRQSSGPHAREASPGLKHVSCPPGTLNEYGGDYHHPGYGRLSVSVNRGRPRIDYNGIAFRARHYDQDVFEIAGEHEDPAVEQPMVMRVSLHRAGPGQVESLSIPFEPDAGDAIFARDVPPKGSTGAS